MLGWLRNLFASLGGGIIGAVRTLIEQLADGIEWTLSHLFKGIKAAWNNFWYGAHQIWWGGKSLGWATEGALWQIAHWVIPRINRTFSYHWRTIWRLYETNKLLTWRLYGAGKHYSWSLVFTLTKFVIFHVLGPLLALGVKVAWYIINRITPLWDLVMHPDKLVRWIFWHFIALLETLAVDVAKRTTRFFLALLIHNLRTVIIILEDAINAVL